MRYRGADSHGAIGCRFATGPLNITNTETKLEIDGLARDVRRSTMATYDYRKEGVIAL